MSPALKRLHESWLYLVTPTSPKAGPLDDFLAEVLDAGVDIVQLREKEMEAKPLVLFAEVARRRTQETNALLIINDRVDVAIAAGADGVHLGQDDLPPHAARIQAGKDFVIGLSTHTLEEVVQSNDSAADYIGVGPVHETPTKLGRPAAGVELVSFAASNASKPFFAIGGIDIDNVDEVVAAGATRISVLRALTEADEPGTAARRLRRALESGIP
jgi:thiamine-phosphate pyrophosphorylase